MELYAAIGRKFRTLFMRQEHMKTFKTYDRLEVCSVGYKISYKVHNYKWFPSVFQDICSVIKHKIHVEFE